MKINQLPYEIILNICRYIPIKNLRKFCRINKFSDDTLNNIIKTTIKWHITYGLGIPMKTFYQDCIYYIHAFFNQCHDKSLDSIEKYSKFTFDKKVYEDFLENENLECQELDLLYLFFITKLSESWIWNKKIVKKLLLHTIEDNIFLFSSFWVNYVSIPKNYNDNENHNIEIYKMVLKNKLYINYNILVTLFDNTYFPIEIISKSNLFEALVFPSEKFLINQRIIGNPYQIHNYNLIKELFRLNIRQLYLKLIREERKYIKKIVRIGNPYGKGKTIKLSSSLFEKVQSRLKREGFIGTLLDLQLEKKLLIDEYQKLLF